MKFRFNWQQLLLWSALAALPQSSKLFVDGIYLEDAGTLDFLIATTGHSATRFVHSALEEGTVITSDAGAGTGSSSCYVASRNVDDGSLQWRRNVCSTPSTNQNHAMTVSTTGNDNSNGGNKTLVTVDNLGVVRAWTVQEGNLLWEAKVPSSSASTTPNVWTFKRNEKEYVAVASDELLTIFEAESGKQFDSINGITALSQQGYGLDRGEALQCLSILPGDGDSGPLNILYAFVSANGDLVAGHRMFMVQLDLGDDQLLSAVSLGRTEPMKTSSIQIFQVGRNEYQGLALNADSSSAVHFSVKGPRVDTVLAANKWHPSWTSLKAVTVPDSQNPSLVAVQGFDNEGQEMMALFQPGRSGWQRLRGAGDDEALGYNAMSYCPQAGIVVGMNQQSLKAFKYQSSDNPSSLQAIPVTGDLFVPDGDPVETFSVLSCSDDTFSALLGTASGTTTQLSFAKGGNDIIAKIGWTAEEGLSSISSAVILDASHADIGDTTEEQDVIMRKLSLPDRLSSQWNNVKSVLLSGAGGILLNRREHFFGFVKVAAVLSQKSHRLWGIDTSGDNRGFIRWSLDLLKSADWHALVHGTTNSPKAMHGINGGTHSRELLVLSSSSTQVEWKCVDGANGAVFSEGTVPVTSKVLQVMPIFGSSGSCRQAAILLHGDMSMSLVPSDEGTFSIAQQQLHNTPNGLYTHLVDKDASMLKTFQVFGDKNNNNAFVSRQVGRTSFNGERIVNVEYPNREEVVQSLCTVLGDDSLLLKYVNPHLAVIITVSDDEEEKQKPTQQKPLSKIASSIKSKEAKPRKPVGASESVDGASTLEAVTSPLISESQVPNLFVNVVDTVSGVVLHRASHINADTSGQNVPSSIISENWIIYTFVNEKTRRTEVGVLTLHEGMIDSKGLNLFSSPEQTEEFSSFDTRVSKPVVLSKTYTFPKAITALGVTTTRGGISSRNILVASDDGKISSIDRFMLETRRPLGDLKDAEKKEGLYP